MEQKNIKINITEDALDDLAKKSLDPQYGGRPVKRVLQKEILNPLSKTLLSEKITGNKDIVIDYFGNEIVFRNTNKVENKAK